MSEERSTLSRRDVLVGGAAASAAIALPGAVATPAAAAQPSRPVLPADPFTLGVASGDPTPDGVVLWTRLATEPLAEDGHGGLPRRPIEVAWEIATDEKFTDVVRRGHKGADHDWAHSVHIEVSGLAPGRDYWYRFKAGNYVSPTGRTKTTPAPDAMMPLSIAVASCSHWGWGYWTCYRHLAEESPDLVLHLGDYFYEGRHVDGQYRVPLPEGGAVTLENYRQRYAQVHTDDNLQAAHAAAPWLVVFDDHEVVDDWYQDDSFRDRRKDAFRAYYENVPLRRSSLPHGSRIPLYRRIRWGRMANLHMLDTRQYRDAHACGSNQPSFQNCPEIWDPSRSILGEEQERWLIDGLASSEATWDVLGQQVPMRQMLHPDPPERYAIDKWDGYIASRDRVLNGFTRSGAENLFVLDGDVHQYFAAELKEDFDDPDSRTIGTEITTTSISSGSDGADVDLPNDPWLQRNPHIKYHNLRRGYTLATFTETEVTAHLRGVDYVSRPGAPRETRATYRIHAGDPGLEEVYVQPTPRTFSTLGRDENIRRSIAMQNAD